MTTDKTDRHAPKMLRNRPKRQFNIVLFGEVLADIFPDRTVLGGAPFNVARHLKAFGQNPLLITRMGNDSLRDEVLSAMSKSGMETLGIQTDNLYPTGQVVVHILEQGHRFEILPMQAYDFIHSGVAHMSCLSANPDMVYYGTLAQRNDVSRRALKNLLRSTNAAKFLDINLRTPWYDEKVLRHSLKNAQIVKINNDELAELTQLFALPGTTDEQQALELITLFDLSELIITCGNRGAWHINREGKKIAVKPANIETGLADTVGAGDGFASVCILGELKRWPMRKTLERAHAFAGAICTIRGAIPDHAEFYQSFTKEWGI